MNLNCFRSFVVFGLLATFSGCASPSLAPLPSRTAAFSTAATAAAIRTTNAYQLINQVHADAQMATLVAQYDRTPFDAGKITQFLPEKDLAVRTEVLNGIMQYATLLAEVSGDQPISDLEAQAVATGIALQNLQQDDFKGFKINDTDRTLAVNAVTAIGGVLIQHARARALPEILDKMNQPIQQICNILVNDIGVVGKAGLADALHTDYGTQIAAEQNFITDNANTLSADQKRIEIETLPKLVLAQRQSDQALAATAKLLTDLAAAHAALAATKAQKNSPAFKLELSQLLQDAQTAYGYYTSVSPK